VSPPPAAIKPALQRFRDARAALARQTAANSAAAAAAAAANAPAAAAAAPAQGTPASARRREAQADANAAQERRRLSQLRNKLPFSPARSPPKPKPPVAAFCLFACGVAARHVREGKSSHAQRTRRVCVEGGGG